MSESDFPISDGQSGQLVTANDPQFIHLRIHSDYSMSDGLKKVKPIVARAAELNMPAMALR